MEVMAVLGLALFIALWLGVALGVVLCEPLLRKKSLKEAHRRYKAQIKALQAQLDVQTVAQAFQKDRDALTLPVIDAEGE